MKEVRIELAYGAGPAAVFELFGAGDFQLELIAHIGGRQPELIEEERAADGSVRLVTSQRNGVELPGFAKKLIPAETSVVQTYAWGPPESDGSRRGTWSAEVRGAPISMGGDTEMSSDGAGGTIHRYGGQVKASVPVVGGRLEGFALDNLKKELERCRAFVTERLSG